MKRIIYAIFLAIFSMVSTSCEEGDGFKEYGLAKIYMPQATVSGGLNNDYFVPSGEGEYTYNFKVDKTKKELQIILGVLRSGTLSNEAYSVDIISRIDTTNQILSEGLIPDGILFPANAYSLPAKVSVPNNKSGESFYMIVSIDELNKSIYTDKKLVLTVAITNPTKFELSEENTNTVVILDVNAIREYIN